MSNEGLVKMLKVNDYGIESKIWSHCEGTVKMREDSESGIRK